MGVGKTLMGVGKSLMAETQNLLWEVLIHTPVALNHTRVA